MLWIEWHAQKKISGTYWRATARDAVTGSVLATGASVAGPSTRLAWWTAEGACDVAALRRCGVRVRGEITKERGW